MRFLRTLLDVIFRRSRAESEMAQEIRFHMESRATDLVRSGLTPADAKRQARLEFGSVESHKENCREASGFRPLDEIRADLRYAFRTLRKSAGFTAMAVLSLALGIGVNISMFVSLYYVVLHPFPYPNLDRIMNVSGTRAKSQIERLPVTVADYLDWKQSARSFESLGAYRGWDVNLTGVDRPDHIQAALASAEFFNVLGMRPIQGGTFSPAECEPGKDAVVVVSHGFWRTRLAGKPEAIGESISLGGRTYTVVGVMPETFDLPLSSELWAPLAFTREERTERNVASLMVLGKLRPGISAEQAAAEMDALARRLEELHPNTNEDRGVLVGSMQELMKTESHRFVMVLMGAALFVLLLACTNVGSLQVARTLGRQREFGQRSALGASLPRILRQLLTESLVLGLTGGAVGLALAAWHLSISRSTIPAMVYRFVPGLRDMRISGEIVLAAVALSVVVSLVCYLPAMFQVVRQGIMGDVRSVLQEGGRSSTGSRSRSRLRSSLVIAEVALAFVLLVGAGLMVGMFQRMLDVKLGYDATNVLSGQIALNGNQYGDPARIRGFYDAVLRSLAGLPDVRGAAVDASLGHAIAVSIQGRQEPRPGEPKPEIRATTPQYLDVMRIPLLSGRWIAQQDGPDAPPVVVLSASVVRHYWPDTSPIGQRVRLGGAEAPWLTVVGVAGDVNDWFLGNPMPAAYVSHPQFPQASTRVLVRTSHDPRGIARALRSEIQAFDREQPIYNVRTLEQQLREETSGVRNAANMMLIYAGIALLLAVTGIYSISSYFVAERTREIGVRMSLGATRQTILKMVLSRSCVMSGVGLLIGLPLAIMMTMGMSAALYNAVTLQPIMFVVVTILLGGLAVIAGYIPAHRAARVDPMVALRQQ